MNYSTTAIYTFILTITLASSSSCNPEKTDRKADIPIVLKKFDGNYSKTFNDLQEAHMEAALKNGITPLETRADTSGCMDKLTRLPMELEVYKMDELTHSIPYLTNHANDLFLDICINFRDSLVRKNIPLHKLILTSVTRTNEDVAKLTKRNNNASENSVHRYATTFDISWRRFEKINPNGKDISIDKLKKVLGEVLYDLRQQDRCYIKHERKQACFHITVL